MAELATIARPYAEAAFASRDGGMLPKWPNKQGLLAVVASDAKLPQRWTIGLRLSKSSRYSPR